MHPPLEPRPWPWPGSLALAVAIGGGCAEPPANTSRPDADASEVAPAASDPPADLAQTSPAPRTCPDKGLAAFDCTRPTLCAAVDTTDQQVTLTEFLCGAAQAPSSEGPLRVGDILRTLPTGFRTNFTLKHGTRERGLRGHPQELMADVVSDALAQRSQSADLDFPRVFMWDQATGFTISYNGGLTATDGATRSQTGADRMDLMGWDATARTFELWGLDLPVAQRGAEGAWTIAPYQPRETDDNCTHCHGPRSRPIWPMYPDWPGLYGSDNDELSGDTGHQRTEREFLAYFRACVATEPKPGGTAAGTVDCDRMRQAAAGHTGVAGLVDADVLDTRRRYDTLFAADLEQALTARFDDIDGDQLRAYLEGLDDRFSARTVAKIRTPVGLAAVQGTAAQRQAWLGLTQHETWPYRPNRAEQSTEPSRAFFHRPNLRLGVLYNRLTALNVFELLRAHPRYERFDRLLAASLMDCDLGDTRGPTIEAFVTEMKPVLAPREMPLGDPSAKGYRIPYPVLLAAFDLRVRDVDIRYSYPNRRFDRFDRGDQTTGTITNPMKLGYLGYRRKDFNAANGASRYWNSYFDGSATTDELLVALLLADIATRSPDLAALYTPQTLAAKYGRFVSRQVLDAEFFAQMDALSGWVPLPYPKRLAPIHHRQSFHHQQQGNRVFRTQYTAVCTALRDQLAAP